MSVLKLIDKLNQIASEIDVQFPYWLSGGGADEGLSFCFECANKNVSDDVEVNGGWVQDSDSCCHCEECGILLDYNLTEVGVASELEHFIANGITSPVNPEIAYHLLGLLEHHLESSAVLALVPSITNAIKAHTAQEVAYD